MPPNAMPMSSSFEWDESRGGEWWEFRMSCSGIDGDGSAVLQSPFGGRRRVSYARKSRSQGLARSRFRSQLFDLRLPAPSPFNPGRHRRSRAGPDATHHRYPPKGRGLLLIQYINCFSSSNISNVSSRIICLSSHASTATIASYLRESLVVVHAI